jgi:hypothetical protein
MGRPDDARPPSGEGVPATAAARGPLSCGCEAPQVHFHVGLGKAASTYLQHAFFPRLEGVRYIRRTAYRTAPERIRAAAPGLPFLVSREFDQQLERECRWFRDALPEADIRPLIVLRRQDGWLASQYRRHVKNGSPLSFPEFVDVAGDTGLWSREDARFLPMLELLEALFGHRPTVLFHEDLRRDPRAFLDATARAVGAAWDPVRVSLDAVHRSYSERQLLWMRRASRRWFPEPIAHGRTPWWRRRGRLLACYAVLHGSRLLPDAWTPEGPLIEPEALARVREAYADDWAACLRYAGRPAGPS